MVNLQSALERMNANIECNHRALNHPGLAIGVTNRERLLFVGNYGLADRERQIPVTSDHLFQIGSISKAFTSIALLQTQEQGLLSIDDPVNHYLPWFEVQSDYGLITLRHLMSHTAGILMGTDATQSAYTEAWNLRHSSATAPPGEMFHYSNIGYKILGLVLQKILKRSMNDILIRNIFSPLGMSNTEAVIINDIRARLAVGYEAFYDDRPLPSGGKLAPATWFEYDNADGSISSNATDMCCYLRALLNRGGGLLTSESFDELIQPLISTNDGLHGEQYGLGLCIRQIEGHQILSHGGGMIGYTADIQVDMDEGLGVVVLTNGPGDPEIISQYALNLIWTAKNGQELPAFPSTDPSQITDDVDYAGFYRCADKEFILTSQGNRLRLEFEGDSVPLESCPPHGFIVPHPAFELFFLRFGREKNPNEKNKAQIIEAFHGPDWYIHSRYQGESSFEIPTEWQAYIGHYRAYNPWLTNFRVVIQKDSLVLIHQWDAQETLYQTGPGSFRVGSDPRSPEFMLFDLLIDGKAQLANLSGGDYCRILTP